MPIYEYQCDACGHHLEEIQKFSDSPLTTCPACKKPKLRRLVSHTSFQLKGGGYYATDYKKPEKKEPETKTPDAAKPVDTPKTPEKKPEKKPDKDK